MYLFPLLFTVLKIQKDMRTDTVKAKELLFSGKHTCVLCKGERVYTSNQRGVAPLISWLNSKTDLKGFSAADKVVGKAAAFLYVLLGTKEVYADIISEPALETFNKYGISCHYNEKVKAIRNRTDTGFCPMETSVLATQEPEEALKAILRKLEELKNGN